jgi:sulfate/thiosulfate transport system permease protein
MKKSSHSLGARVLILAVVLYVGFLILAPIFALIRGAFHDGLPAIWQSLTAPALAESVWLSLRIALLVVLVQTLLGTLVAWIIVRHRFAGKALLDGLIDIPFAVSPVVVGYMLLLLFGRNSFLFPLLERLGVRVAFALPGIFLATLFVSLPFMIKEMIPIIQTLDREQEVAAATLGASQWTIFWRIIFPQMKTALIYGMTLTFARALGEFGAVLVIGGGVQGRTETATLYIFRALEERRSVEAYTAAILLGAFSVSIVLLADWLKRRQRKSKAHEAA